MIELVIIVLAGAVATVGGIAYARKRRAVRAYLPGRADTRVASGDAGVVLNPTPSQIRPGDELQIARPDDIEPGTYLVQAASTYTDDDDETWSELEIQDIGSDQRYFLTYAQDDEARWQWSLFRSLSDQELDAPGIHEVLDRVGMRKEQAPPKELAFLGRTWRVQRGNRHYKVWVEDWRADRADSDEYEARMTDYREVGGHARLGIEVWEDGLGVAVSAGPVGEITRIRR